MDTQVRSPLHHHPVTVQQGNEVTVFGPCGIVLHYDAAARVVSDSNITTQHPMFAKMHKLAADHAEGHFWRDAELTSY